MILLVRSGVGCLQLLLSNSIRYIALLAQIKVEAVVTFVSYPHYWHLLAAMAFYVLSDLLSWFDNKLNLVRLMIMTSNFQCFHVIGPRKETILAHAEMAAVGTNETSTDDGSHIATNTLIVVMGGQTVCKQWQFNAEELVVFAEYFFRVLIL